MAVTSTGAAPAGLAIPARIAAPKLLRIVDVAATALDGVVDIDPAGLVGLVVIALATLEGVVDVDFAGLHACVAIRGERNVSACEQ